MKGPAPNDMRQTDLESSDSEPDNAAPLVKQVFASLFTPSWSLGLLLSFCFVMPCYRGCNGDAIRPVQVVRVETASPAKIYLVFLVTWPFVFGLLVTIGTIHMLAHRGPAQARLLWRLLAALITLNPVLLFAASIELALKGKLGWDVFVLILLSMALVGVVLLTRRLCRSWFNAAMWLQACLGIAASASVSIYIPLLFLSNGLLWGGQIAIASTACLVLATVIQRLDGQRVLTRSRGESPLRLSLRSMLGLMLLGGLVATWITNYMLPATTRGVGDSQDRPKAPTLRPDDPQ